MPLGAEDGLCGTAAPQNPTMKGSAAEGVNFDPTDPYWDRCSTSQVPSACSVAALLLMIDFVQSWLVALHLQLPLMPIVCLAADMPTFAVTIITGTPGMSWR